MATSLRDGAPPFIPGGGSASMQAPSGSQSTGGAAFKVTAAPFVPGGTSPKTPLTTSHTPGAHRGFAAAAAAGLGSQTPTASATPQLTSSAQPFVPAAARAATGNGTSTPLHRTANTPGASPHQETRGGGGGRGGGAGARGGKALAAAAAAAAGSSGGVAASDSTYASHTSHGYQGGRGGGRHSAYHSTASVPATLPVTDSVTSYPHSPATLTNGGIALGGRGGGSSSVLSSPGAHSARGAGVGGGGYLGGRGGMHGLGKHHGLGGLPPGKAALSSQSMEESLRQQLQQAAYRVQAKWTNPASSKEGLVLPDKLNTYHTLYPLDALPTPPTSSHPAPDTTSHALGLRTLVLKGISSVDGKPYLLRRIDGKQVYPSHDVVTAAHRAVEVWGGVGAHPNLVCLRGVFTSHEVEGSNALFYVYDYHPGCTTLASAHMSPSMGQGGMVSIQPPTERQLWSYLVQLTNLLRAVHAQQLVLRPNCLHPTKVLVTPTGRLRVGCCGLVDSVHGDPAQERDDWSHAQRSDLHALGQLMLSLACAGLTPPGHPASVTMMEGRVSEPMSRIVKALLQSLDPTPSTTPVGFSTVQQLYKDPVMVEALMNEMQDAETVQDHLVNDLSKECENGRLLRLLIKLGFVVERPQGDVDSTWAETGDRYLLKLFRDFVFFQRVPEGSPNAGAPLLDWGYVVEALNKLDAGVAERIMLLTRDESAMLVASYADLKRCVEAAYQGLSTHTAGRMLGVGGVGVGAGTGGGSGLLKP